MTILNQRIYLVKIHHPDSEEKIEVFVIAESGNITSTTKLEKYFKYKAIALPNEHLNQAAFSLVINPENPIASPFG